MKIDKQNLLLKSATYLAVTNGTLIFLLKLYGYFCTGSASFFGSLVDAGVDVASSTVNMVALRYALTPPDDNHRFGHEKIQDVAAFGQGMFFIASSLFVLANSITKYNEHNITSNVDTGIVIMLIATFFTSILVLYQTYVLSIVKSPLVKADKLHYFTDILTNLTVIISMYTSQFFWFIDPLFGVAIAIYLFAGAYEIMSEGLSHLLDEEMKDADKKHILKILKRYKANKSIIAIHDLRTRKAGNRCFIQLHVEIDGSMKLIDSHAITEKIEADILQVFPDSCIIIHQDPTGIEEETPFRDVLENDEADGEADQRLNRQIYAGRENYHASSAANTRK